MLQPRTNFNLETWKVLVVPNPGVEERKRIGRACHDSLASSFKSRMRSLCAFRLLSSGVSVTTNFGGYSQALYLFLYLSSLYYPCFQIISTSKSEHT